jgi:putative phosphotransacetylase
MIQQVKPASACADCRLCSRGQVCAPDNGSPDIDEIVQEVIRRVRPGPTPLVGVPVGVSARHCHVNRESMDILFGPGSELTPFRHLYQPGAFAANEYISVVGPRLRAIERVRILGPMRDYDQVELARTDSIYLGLQDPPVRDSGDLDDALPVTFIGPKGAVTVHAAIRATRHIHLSPDDTVRMGVDGRSEVCVRVDGEKGLVFENVRLKVDESFIPEIHLDTDDANAAGLACGDTVRIEP